MQKFNSLLLIAIFCLSIFTLQSCKTSIDGDLNPNNAPETSAVVDTIIRDGDDRFNSQVEISWWATDVDGYIAGYEFTFDNPITSSTNWVFTTATDSTFLLPTPVGTDSADFRFSVRAIDNDNLVDETPAQLTYPVKNTPPTISFNNGIVVPRITYPAFKTFIHPEDPDGVDNLSKIQIWINDTLTTPIELDPNTSSFTLVAQTPMSSTSTCDIYLNNSSNVYSQTISGLLLNDYNQIFARAIDLSGSESTISWTDSIYVKQVQSTLLLVNAHNNGAPQQTKEQFYIDRMNDIGKTTFDTLRLFKKENGEFIEKSLDNLTQSRVFDLFDGIIWFGDNASTSLPIAQKTTSNFFANNGKLLMSVYVPGAFDEQSSFLDFTPVNSLDVPTNDSIYLMLDTCNLIPQIAGWPNVELSGILTVVRPLNLFPDAIPIYNGEIIARHPPTNFFGPKAGIMMAGRQNSSGQFNFIFTSLELDRFNDLNNMDQFFQKAIVDEFGL